jgi:hypothetical protein
MTGAAVLEGQLEEEVAASALTQGQTWMKNR